MIRKLTYVLMAVVLAHVGMAGGSREVLADDEM
jgi:hypothetical protein